MECNILLSPLKTCTFSMYHNKETVMTLKDNQRKLSTFGYKKDKVLLKVKCTI